MNMSIVTFVTFRSNIHSWSQFALIGLFVLGGMMTGQPATRAQDEDLIDKFDVFRSRPSVTDSLRRPVKSDFQIAPDVKSSSRPTESLLKPDSVFSQPTQDRTIPSSSIRFVRKLPGSPEFLPRPSAIEQQILKQLDQPTEVTFRDNELTMALDHLKDLHGIEIRVEPAQVAAQDIKVTLETSKIPLRSCLNLLLEPNDLCYFIEDDVLKVTTRQAAESKFITRTVPCRRSFQYAGRSERTGEGFGMRTGPESW